MKLHYTGSVNRAAIILSLLSTSKGFYKGLVDVSRYSNGREEGFCLSAGGNKLCFSEYRNSDDIVIYAGKASEFDAENGNIPSESIYEKKVFFKPSQLLEAVGFIEKFFR